MLAVIIGLAIGFGLPVQTGINTRLRNVFGSPFLSSLISFAIGTVFLAGVTALATGQLWPGGTFIAHQPGWLWLGGVFGVIYLTSNILLFPKIGSVQTVIFPVLGQILMGLLIDNGGWFGAPTQALTVSRVLGALLVLLGVLATVALPGYLARHRRQTQLTQTGSSLWLWRLWGVVAGMLSASQTAINGKLGLVLHSAYQAAFISFFVGTVLLVIIVLALHPHVTFRETQAQHTWWMWLGGLIGGCFVLGNAYLAPVVGTGLAVVIVLVGLMIGSLLIDQFGWLGAPRNPINAVQFLGLIVMIGGVVLIRLIK